MRRAAIVSPVRTPVGAFGGALRDVPVETLGSVVTKAVLERTGLDPASIEDVTFAQSYANSETPLRRPLDRPRGGAADRSAGPPNRSPLRRRPSGDRHCGDDGADRRLRRRARWRRREHEPDRILYD